MPRPPTLRPIVSIPLALALALAVLGAVGVATRALAQDATAPRAEVTEVPAEKPAAEKPAATAKPAPDAPFSIRPSVQEKPSGHRDPETGDVVMIASPLSALLAQAHGVHPLDMVPEGGVDLDKKYDVLLRAGAEKNRDLVAMLGAGVQLALGLEVERQTRRVPINRLRRREGTPPLAPSTASEQTAEVASGRLAATKLPMRELVAFLRWRSPRPVVDETGLDGRYDFVLEWDPSAGTPALFLSLHDLGLEIAPDEGDFEFLVVRPTP